VCNHYALKLDGLKFTMGRETLSEDPHAECCRAGS